MNKMIETDSKNWLDIPIKTSLKLNKQTAVFILIFVIAVVSRLYMLGERVMSHDEINHVYFAYQFYKGGEYVHNPITHGPLQFHLLELSYFLFNASDFSARLPAAFFSLITILFIWKFRRYLGNLGAIAAAGLFTISPFMLYYGRYARNESIAIFFTLATVWTVLRYLENGENKYLYLTAAFTALHFATKETAFIFTAQLMTFLGLLFIYKISKTPWKKPLLRKAFLILLLFSATLLISALFFPGNLEQTETEVGIESGISQVQLVLIVSAGLIFIIGFITLILGYGWDRIKNDRAFGMLLFQFSLVFPQLAAFPAFWAKIPLTEYTNIEVVTQVSIILAIFLVISIIAGGAWKPREWMIGAGIYYGIYILLYTSIFSNLGGIYSGMIGSLGYWLEQHGVERGSQPWFYFILVEMPLYEYLALIGTFISGLYIFRWILSHVPKPEFNKILLENEISHRLSPDNSKRISLGLLMFFSISSVFVYMVVGEKMPWLTVHTSWSMWLITGWLFGKLISEIDWKRIFTPRGILATTSILICMISFAYVVTMWLKPIPPFSGSEITDLQTTGKFIFISLIIFSFAWIVYKSIKNFGKGQQLKLVLFSFLFLLGFLTIRHAALASYINYDQATEYLVYAHAARGPKDALDEIESISLRLTGGKELKVGFDNHTAYPFWWYLRDYPNRLEFGENPTRELRNYSVILAGDANYNLLDPIVQNDYVSFEYLRMVWPNQDYFDLNFYKNYLQNPETRIGMLNALFQIWLNRNYEPYEEVTQQDMSLRHWNPSQAFRLYIRKDVAAQIWQYGAGTGSIDIDSDPYAEGKIEITPTTIIADLGLNNPKGLTIANDGSIYIADTGNNRIIHVSMDGTFINEWGSEGSGPGQFNQPWDVAADLEGSIYVTDTWNHRVQKFTSSGEFITTWGVYGQAETPEAFWGPRGITIDQLGNVLIADTGNKRIVIFSSDGNFINAFGSAGFQLGEFDEPVGIASSPIDNLLFVADTWNQRIQSFEYVPDFGYTPLSSWDIDGWYGQSLDNKPFIDSDVLNRVIVADPEAGRILVFSRDGNFISTFGDHDPVSTNGFGLIGGVASDEFGGLWITDSLKNQLRYYKIP